MKLIAIVAALLLSGCGTTYQVRVDADVAPLDPSVAEKCDPVPGTPPRGTDVGKLYTFADNMIALYGDCATRDAGKYNWIKSQGH